jgi:N-formylglutamate amidohydrolase
MIFASPHSGRDYPAEFLAQAVLDRRSIRSSEDAFVDELFDMAPQMGAALLAARAPRAYIDLNRAADELDPAVIEGLARVPHNPRISSGLGVIPRVVAGGLAIYRGKLSLADAEVRLKRFWHPYHQALAALIEEVRAEYGQVVLIDCHSMPHEAIEAHTRPGHPRPEVVLGDRYGAGRGGFLGGRAAGGSERSVRGRLRGAGLWPAVTRCACGSGRDRPGALHGRGAGRTAGRVRGLP